MPEAPTALTTPETGSLQQHEPVNERQADPDCQHDQTTPPKQEAAFDDVPDDTTEPVTRGKRRPDEPVTTRRPPGRERGTATADWRSPAYKLGGTLVAAALVVIVLLALNRRNDDPAPPPLRSTTEPDSLADVSGAPDVDVTLGEPVGDVVSEPQPGTVTAADEPWMAESQTESLPPVSTDSQPLANTSQDDAVVRLGPDVAIAESPRPETTDSRPMVPDTTTTYDTTSNTAWSYRNAGPGPGQRQVAPDLPPHDPGLAAQAEPWPSPTGREAAQRAGKPMDRSLPPRFQRGELTGAGRTMASSPSVQPQPVEVATTQTYPSTPYTATFPNRDGNSVDRGHDATLVRTAERDALGYPRPSQRQMDATRAPARLQGRIEPFTTGSHEHYR